MKSFEQFNEQHDELDEVLYEGGLRDWFGKSKSKDGKKGWVQSDGSPCANEPGETGTPKCYSSRRLAGLKKTESGKKKIRSADARKSAQDSGQQSKSGASKPTNVRTFTDSDDYKKHPSGDGKTKKEEFVPEACWKGYEKKGMKTMFGKRYPNCVKKTKSEEYVPEGVGSFAARKGTDYAQKQKAKAAQPKPNSGRAETAGTIGGAVAGGAALGLLDGPLPIGDAIGGIAGAKLGGHLGKKVDQKFAKNQQNEEYIEEKGDMSGMTQGGGHKRSTESGAGLTQKGVEKYRRQNPGSKLKTAVTTPPSKLKPGSKAAKRRKSFCARSRGWDGERGKAARRRWNC